MGVQKILQRISGNPYFATSPYDQLAFSVFIFGAHLSIWYEVFIVMPFYGGHLSSFRFVHYTAVAIIYVSSLSNLFKMIQQRMEQPEITIGGEHSNWNYCAKCLMYSPPRSHHCKVCNVCVLKRDHHCWFGGVCVGWHNHRFFVVMLIWVWIAALYGNIYHFSFMQEILGTGFGTILCIFAPHVAALLGYLSLSQFFVAFLTLLAFLLLVMFTWMLQIQFTQIYYGQTKYERKHSVKDYNLGWKENVKEVFGDKWYLVWLSPLIPSKLPGNGYEYRRDIKAL